MSSQTIQVEFQEFVQFATRRIERGEAGETVEDLVQQWRVGVDYAQTVADIRQGITDEACGRAVSVSEAFANVRRQVGIPE